MSVSSLGCTRARFICGGGDGVHGTGFDGSRFEWLRFDRMGATAGLIGASGSIVSDMFAKMTTKLAAGARVGGR